MKAKRVLSTLLVFSMLLGILPVSTRAEDDRTTVNGIELSYQNVSDSSVEILAANYSGSTEPGNGTINLEIPSQIDNKSVTKIWYNTFKDMKALRSVTIPASVTTIGYGAFARCTSLQMVTFEGTPTFESVSEHRNRNYYPTDGTFQGCTSLTSITLPTNTTSLSISMFEGCESLTSVNLSELTNLTAIADGAFEGTALSSVKLPGNVTSIGESAFADCKITDGFESPSITSVTLNSGLTSIGESAFASAGITSLTLPDSVTTIGNGSFADCKNLATINWPNNNQFTTVTGFAGCTALGNSVLTGLPSSVTAIGTDAFMGCTFTEISLPTTIESIGNQAFHGCQQVAAITLPETLKTIGERAFVGCKEVTSLTVPESVASIGSHAFALGSDSLTLTVLNRDLVLKNGDAFISILGNMGGAGLQWSATVRGYQYKSDRTTESDLYAYIHALQNDATYEHAHYTFVPLDDAPAAETYTVSGTVSPADATINVKKGGVSVAPPTVNNDGTFSFEVSNATDVTVTFSKDGYYSRSFTRAAGSTGNWVIKDSSDNNTITLTQVPMNKTLTVSVSDSTGRLYSSFDGLTLTLGVGNTPLTEGIDYTLQFPYITLKDSTNTSAITSATALTLTATPNSSLQCGSTTASATLAAPSLKLVLPAWGNVTVTATGSFAGGNNVLIFDSTGKLAEYGTIDPPAMSYTSGRLQEGSYTAVVFNQNAFLSVFPDRAALANSGMTENTDYASADFTVANAHTAGVNVTVPVLDTSKFGTIVDTDYSCIRLDEDEPLSGVKFRVRVFYGFKSTDTTNGTLTLNIPTDATVGEVYNESGRLTSGSGYTVSGTKITFPVSRNRGVFFLNLTISGSGNRYLSASLSDGTTTSPLDSCAFDVYSTRLLLPADYFEKKTQPVTVSVKAAPNTSVAVAVNGTQQTTVSTDQLGQAKANLTPPDGIKAGEDMVITTTAGGAGDSGTMTYYPTETYVKEFFFTQYRSKYYIVKNGQLDTDIYYNYMYEDADDDEYKYWSFSATINTGYAIVGDSVFVTVTMKDGSTKDVPLYLNSKSAVDADTTDYVFGGSMMLEQPSPHSFRNDRVPVRMELNYDTDYGDELAKDLPVNTTAKELFAALRAQMNDETNPDLTWSNEFLNEYEAGLRADFTEWYLIADYGAGVTPANATDAQKAAVQAAVDAAVSACMEVFRNRSAQTQEEIDNIIYGSNWEIDPSELPGWDTADPTDKQNMENLASSMADWSRIAEEIGKQLAAGLLASYNAMGAGGNNKDGSDLNEDMGAKVPETTREKLKNKTLDTSGVETRYNPQSDKYTFVGPQGDILMELDTSIMFGKVTNNAEEINSGDTESAEPGKTDQSASGFDISSISTDALSALVDWSGGWWIGNVATFIENGSLPYAALNVRYAHSNAQTALGSARNIIRQFNSGSGTVTPARLREAVRWIRESEEKIAAAEQAYTKVDNTVKAFKYAGLAASTLSVGNTTVDAIKLKNQIDYWEGEKVRYDKLAKYYENLAPGECLSFPTKYSCVAACKKASLHALELKNLYMQFIKFYGTDVAFAVAGVCPFSAPACAALALGGTLYSMCADDAKSQLEADITATELKFKNEEKNVRRYCKLQPEPCPDPNPGSGSGSGSGGPGGGGSGDGGTGSGGISAHLTPGLDPSGIVYEAVESNVLSGASAELWYNTSASDSGAVQWNAGVYGGQVNPQTTGDDGAYSWYVPDGYYQVKVSKDGYTTWTTGWLEVPPPQLGVNIGLSTNTAPAVQSANAYPDYVEIIFDQYMSTTDALTVPAGYTCEWVNQEKVNSTSSTEYSKVLHLIPTAASAVGSTVNVTISGAKNYTGTALPAYDSGSLTVQTRPAQIVLNYTGTISTHVGESPAPRVTARVLDTAGDPIPGLTVTAALSNDLFATVTAVDATTNADGIATFSLTGTQPGAAKLNLSVSGTSLSEARPVLITSEKNRPERPTAVVGGTTLSASAPKDNYVTVYSGQTMTLSCATEDAVIYYTTDGTCPCQNTVSRVQYTKPITLTENGYYRIAAYKDGQDYSERLNITVTVGNLIPDVPVGPTDAVREGVPTNPSNTGQKPEPTFRFDDVMDKEKWYFDAVYYCYANNYFKGISNTRFDPQGTMTRAMFATVLYRIAGEPEVEGENRFADVKAGSYYTDAVIWTANNQIIDGYGNGKFGTNDPVTREQMLALLWRLNGKPSAESGALSGYSDKDEISDWAKAAFEWAVGIGVINGKGSGILDPSGVVTRAEVAQIVMNFNTKVISAL